MSQGVRLAADDAVAWHHGNPMTEQRSLVAGRACVDLSHFSVLRVHGVDRLPWLHLLLTQSVEHLPAWQSVQALILSATGHIEHDLKVIDDGETTWLIAEPGTSAALVAYLNSMVFLYRVTVSDVTAEYAVVASFPPTTANDSGVTRLAEVERLRWQAPTALATIDRADDPYVPLRPAPWPAQLSIVPRGDVAALEFGAGLWAWEAARVAAGVPRLGLEIDHKTLPHEVGLIGSAVHRAKGCYRGQEAVARTLNLGRPPRRLVLLHLDGTTERLPLLGAPLLTADGREVGRVGTAVVHHELGQVALGVVKRAVDSAAHLSVDVNSVRVAAAVQPIVVI